MKIKEDGSDHTLKHKDSPRPLQLSKSINEVVGLGMTEKQEVQTHIKESLGILVKLHDAPWYNIEKEIPILSDELKDRSCISMSKDVVMVSHDGREIHHKIKDLPGLPLDSRESSAGSTSVDSKFRPLSANMHKAGDYSDVRIGDLVQLSSNQPRPSSVVVKLMGLDMLAASRSSSEIHSNPTKTIPIEDHDSSMIPSRVQYVCKAIQLPKSPRRSRKQPASSRWKNVDAAMKATSSSKLPIEPAPWKHLGNCQTSPKQGLRQVMFPGSSSSTSTVYGEVQKRLKDTEYRQPGKDPRALKQIMEAAQAKGLLEATKEQSPSFENKRDDDQRFGSDMNARMKSNYSRTTRVSGTKLSGSSGSTELEYSIVIMKPAKLVQKFDIPASSIIPVDGFPCFQRAQSGGFAGHQKNLASSTMTMDQPARDGRDQATTADRRTNNRNSRVAQTSLRLTQVSKNNNTNSSKNLGSISPRLQQKKPEFDKRSCPPNPASDPNKTKRQPNRPSTESGSSGGRRREKTSSVQPNDHKLSEKNGSRNLICQEVSASVHPDTHLALKSKVDKEVATKEQPAEIACHESRSLEAIKCFMLGETKNDMKLRMSEQDGVRDLSIAPEQPSPVSVLELSAYMEDSPSPVKQPSHALTCQGDAIAESNENPGEDLRNTCDDLSTDGTALELSSNISRKLQSIDNLVQKLRQLNSNPDESQTDYIASLCEKANPDDRYISEILIASGLPLRYLTSGLTGIELHQSGHPINPELFIVLEQTKASSLLAKRENNADVVETTESNPEKLQRKLIFDVVNEILLGKLNLVASPSEPWLKPDKLGKKTLNAQMLLKELCTEIELLQAKRQDFSLEEEEDGLKNILWEDVMHISYKWTDFQSEVSQIVLDVERSIFRELVNEIIMGEAAALRGWPNRRCKQLFSN